MATTATATETDLVLTPPTPVQAIAPAKAAGLVPIDDAKKTELESRVSVFVEELAALDANSPEFGKRVDTIANLGQKEIRDAAGQSNRFLDRPVRAMDGEGNVGADLAELRRTIQDLDPGKKGNLLAPKKLFGVIPFGNKLRNYFDSYKSSQNHINGILVSLKNGKDELLKDNAAIDTERQALWAAMGRLEQMIHYAKTADTQLEDKANDLDIADPAKAKAIRETALFYVRQRSQDLLTQMAVTVQGYLALDLVKKNNVELMKGVDRLNTTTANIIDSTGKMLREQTAQIHQQAAASTIPLETLKRAFQNIYDTMDAVDRFKLEALGSMKTTVDSLSTEVEKSRGYIARAEGAAQARLTSGGGTADDPFRPV